MLDQDSTVTAALAVLVTVAVVGLLFLGPVGWVLAAAVVLATFVLAEFGGVFDAAATTDRRNCEHCGAPNPPDSEACKHCEASLTDSD